MADTKARVRITGGFSPGTKVGIADRYGDFPPKRLTALQTTTVGDDVTATFTGLPDGARYWVFSIDDDERRVLQATAKAEQQRPAKLSDAEVRSRLAQTTAPRRTFRGNTVTGARSTTNTRVLTASGEPFAGEQTGKPTPEDERELEPQPRLRQEDARNVPQRSATVTGSAHPVDPGEPQPRPSQQDIPANTPQRSATPLGEATPIPPDSIAPAVRQEDAQHLEQRSATETGAAEPKPLGDPIEAAKARDASVAAAAGESDPAPKQADSASRRSQSTERQVRKTVKRDVTDTPKSNKKR